MLRAWTEEKLTLMMRRRAERLERIQPEAAEQLPVFAGRRVTNSEFFAMPTGAANPDIKLRAPQVVRVHEA